jgi:hypothetical protein
MHMKIDWDELERTRGHYRMGRQDPGEAACAFFSLTPTTAHHHLPSTPARRNRGFSLASLEMVAQQLQLFVQMTQYQRSRGMSDDADWMKEATKQIAQLSEYYPSRFAEIFHTGS